MALGLAPGHAVRFRPAPGRRWVTGTAVGVERDGSLSIRDGRGASRAIAVDRVEVRIEGRRGAVRWEPLADVVARTEQLGLF